MADKDFVVKNGIVVNTSFAANSTQFTLSTINATSNGFFANTTQIKIGNSSVNATINSTAFTGDAATVGGNTASTLRTYTDTVGSTAYSNATTFASNATNLTSGIIPYARIPSNIVNTTANFTIGGVTTFNSNVILGSSGLSANGGYGSFGQVLLSNGSATYWGTGTSGTNTQIQFNDSGVANATSGFTFNKTSNLVFVANTISVGNATVNASITSNSSVTYFTGTSNNTSFVGSVAVANVVSNAQLIANLANYVTTTNLTNNLANYQTTAGLSSNVATLTSNNTSFVGSVAVANVVSNAQLIANLSNYTITTTMNSYITGNSATAYTNATSYAASIAATAYSNAVSYASSIASTAYSNATTYAASVAATAYSNAVSYTSSYAPSKTGSGASGTWGINISGSAASLNGYTINQNLGTSNTPTFAGLESNGFVEIYGRSYSQPSIRIRDASAGQISFYDNVDPDLGIYNYTLSMDNGVYDFCFSNTNTAYDIGLHKASIDYNGNIIAAGNMTAYGSPSDRRLKENIAPVKDALHKILALNPVTYDWKKETKEHTMVGMTKDIGFIAQEVQEVIPELVREGGDGYLAIRDRGIIALLVEAIKELQTQVDELKSNR